MMKSLRLALLAALALGGPAVAADLKMVDRTIRKEPVYANRSPRYALLVFGAEAKDRVWLVHDGDTLYVDRNGDGDLTESGEAIATKRGKNHDAEDFGDQFEVADLHVGGRVHKVLKIWAYPLVRDIDEVKTRPNAKATLAADPKARVYTVGLYVDRPGFRGTGIDGQVLVKVGPVDVGGALFFADKPADAPVIHMDGPLQVTTESEPPALKLERDTDLMLVVGTPGLGAGTFAALAYDQVIPDAVVPRVEVLFPPAKEGEPPVRELYELKERC